MKIDIDNSFNRDAKKLPDAVLDELKAIYIAIEATQSLDELAYSIKKMEGSRKLKAFRLRLSDNSDY